MLLKVPGVYGPCRDSELIAAAVPGCIRSGDRALDLFTGSGILATASARAGAEESWAVDVSGRAVASAMINARLNGVKVRARRGHMFEPVAEQRFDLITANPPYVPEVSAGSVTGAARAWEGGPDGRKFLDPLLAGLAGHLRPGGRVLVVHSSLCGIDRTLELLTGAGLDSEIIASESAPLGPITAPRAEALERMGLLARGVRTEETVVIRGALRSRIPRTDPKSALAAA